MHTVHVNRHFMNLCTLVVVIKIELVVETGKSKMAATLATKAGAVGKKPVLIDLSSDCPQPLDKHLSTRPHLETLPSSCVLTMFIALSSKQTKEIHVTFLHKTAQY